MGGGIKAQFSRDRSLYIYIFLSIELNIKGATVVKTWLFFQMGQMLFCLQEGLGIWANAGGSW